MEAINRLLDAALEVVDQHLRESEQMQIGCGACQHGGCCSDYVAVTRFENDALDAALALPGIEERVKTWLARAGVIAASIEAAPPLPGREPMFARYRWLREPCPALVDGRCGIHEARPTSCRFHVSLEALDAPGAASRACAAFYDGTGDAITSLMPEMLVQVMPPRFRRDFALDLASAKSFPLELARRLGLAVPCEAPMEGLRALLDAMTEESL